MIASDAICTPCPGVPGLQISEGRVQQKNLGILICWPPCLEHFQTILIQLLAFKFAHTSILGQNKNGVILPYCSDMLKYTLSHNNFMFQIILTSGLHRPMEKSRTSCVSEPLLLRVLLLFCAALIALHSNKAEQHRLRASPVRAGAGGCTDALVFLVLIALCLSVAVCLPPAGLLASLRPSDWRLVSGVWETPADCCRRLWRSENLLPSTSSRLTVD